MALVGLLVGLGCLQVAQRNAIFLKSYAVGERTHHVHTQETQVAWLSTQVTGLASPMRLAEIAEERRLKLVAWSTLSPPLQRDAGSSHDGRSLVTTAALDPSTGGDLDQATSNGGTAD